MSEKKYILFFIIITSIWWNCHQIDAAAYIDLIDQNNNNNQRCINNFPNIISPFCDEKGFFQLDVAAAQGDDMLLTSLINNGAKLYPYKKNGTPFHWAARRGNLKCLELLWKAYKDTFTKNLIGLDFLKDTNNLTPLCYAVMGGRDYNNGKKFDYVPSMQSLKRPQVRTYLNIITWLLDHGSNINHENGMPLLLAYQLKNFDIVSFLLLKEAKCNKLLNLPRLIKNQFWRGERSKYQCANPGCINKSSHVNSYGIYYCSDTCKKLDPNPFQLWEPQPTHRVILDDGKKCYFKTVSLQNNFPEFKPLNRPNEP